MTAVTRLARVDERCALASGDKTLTWIDNFHSPAFTDSLCTKLSVYVYFLWSISALTPDSALRPTAPIPSPYIASEMYELDSTDEASSFHEDMIKVVDRLPEEDEYRRVRHLVLQRPFEPPFTDDQLAEALGGCPHLETVVLSGAPNVTDRTIVLLAERAINLQGINLTGCDQVTDVGVLELTTKSLPLQWIQLNGVAGITDPSVSAIAKTCSRLNELELSDLPLLTPLSVRDVWSFSR